VTRGERGLVAADSAGVYEVDGFQMSPPIDPCGAGDTVVAALRLSQQGGGGVVAAADSLAGSGHGETATQRAASTLRIGRDVLRDLLVVTTQAEGAGLVNSAQREAWVAWGHEVHSDGVIDALQALNVGIERFTTGIQPNIKMALEQTLLEIGAALAGTGRRAAS
jgi:bifunctional ADP-heptose synthase (sugar kinase/adenylyltransferase)